MLLSIQVIGQICQGPLSVTVIGSKSNIPIVIDEESSNVYCTASDEGEITLTVYGGSPAYQCRWSHDTITTDIATDLSPGFYQVTVTDANGCSDERTMEILFMDPLLDSLTLVDHRACGECYLSDGQQSYFYFEDEYIATIIDLETERDLGSTQVCADFDDSGVSTYGDPKLVRCWTVLSDSIENSDYRLFFTGDEFSKLADAMGYSTIESMINSYALYVQIFPLDPDSSHPFGRMINYGDFTITKYDERQDVWSLEIFGVENAKIELLAYGSLLPLELLSFEGKAGRGVNHLFWATANEVNSTGFHVERSLDGIFFEKLDFVESGRDNYTFDDNHPLVGDNYYRLRMADIDGSFTYSHIIRLTQETSFTFKVVNNPFMDKLYLEVTSPIVFDASFTIVDMSGQIIHSQNQSVARDFCTIELSLSNLHSGNYIIRMLNMDTKKIISRKIVKI